MTNNIEMMEAMKRKSIRLYNGMIVAYQQYTYEEQFDIQKLPIVGIESEGYSINNGIICFIHNNEAFVTPETKKVIEQLELEGLTRKHFCVPFSVDGAYPRNEKAKWDEMLKRAKQEHAREFLDECTRYCDKHNIGKIQAEMLERCLKIPMKGIKVKNNGVLQRVYPLLNSGCLDSVAESIIGHFACSNGVIVFVYRDGKTYLSRDSNIILKLKELGYLESRGVTVPLSNGEIICDFLLRYQWENNN